MFSYHQLQFHKGLHLILPGKAKFDQIVLKHQKFERSRSATLKRSFTFCLTECKAYLPNLNWSNKTHRFYQTQKFNLTLISLFKPLILHIIKRLKNNHFSCRNHSSLWTQADVCGTWKSLRALVSSYLPTQSPSRPGASSPSSLTTFAM